MKIIIDFDNTIGVPACDCDDGLAMLYLLADPEIEILGLSCSYGNSDVETVYRNTKCFLAEIGREDLQLYKGSPQNSADRRSDASEFLADTAAREARTGQKIAILATGSQTNLFAAYKADQNFFNNLSALSIMGGVTEKLLIRGKHLPELNLSCDPEASLCVLQNARNLSIATAQNCLSAAFSRQEFAENLKGKSPAGDYINETLQYWFDHHKENYNIDGFINWDTVAAAYLARPELFIAEKVEINPDLKSLEKGILYGAGDKISCNLPRIADPAAFKADVFAHWNSLELK